MLLFRSEEHIERWCEQQGVERGGTMSPDTALKLATAWFGDRQNPGWRRKTAAEAEAVFRELGLVGDFWKLTP
jgi:hypothetical protein